MILGSGHLTLTVDLLNMSNFVLGPSQIENVVCYRCLGLNVMILSILTINTIKNCVYKNVPFNVSMVISYKQTHGRSHR